MPAPGRGVAVLQTGTVTAVAGGVATVTVGADTLTVPYLVEPSVDDEVWVLSSGRAGLLLGGVQT